MSIETIDPALSKVCADLLMKSQAAYKRKAVIKEAIFNLGEKTYNVRLQFNGEYKAYQQSIWQKHEVLTFDPQVSKQINECLKRYAGGGENNVSVNVLK